MPGATGTPAAAGSSHLGAPAARGEPFPQPVACTWPGRQRGAAVGAQQCWESRGHSFPGRDPPIRRQARQAAGRTGHSLQLIRAAVSEVGVGVEGPLGLEVLRVEGAPPAGRSGDGWAPAAAGRLPDPAGHTPGRPRTFSRSRNFRPVAKAVSISSWGMPWPAGRSGGASEVVRVWPRRRRACQWCQGRRRPRGNNKPLCRHSTSM